MKRVLALTGIIAVVGAASFLVGRGAGSPPNAASNGTPESTWYHASDVSSLSHSARPKLVEFFHPG